MSTPIVRRSRARRSGDPKAIELTARDIELLRLLNRYRFLRSTFIRAFLAGSHQKITRRLRDLFDGHYVTRVHPQFRVGNLRSHPEVYELGHQGVAVLRALGLYSPFDRVTIRPGRNAPRHEFHHDLYICDLLASLELGVKRSGLRFINLYEILERAPQATRDSASPMVVSGEGTRMLTPDAIFGVEYPDPKNRFAFFILEADRATEPITRSARGSSYEKKMLAYKEMAKAIRAHFNIPNFRVLTVTVSETHMNNIIKVVPSPTMFLFKTLASFGNFERPPEPTPTLFTKAWRRGGGLDPESIDGLASETSGTDRPAKAA